MKNKLEINKDNYKGYYELYTKITGFDLSEMVVFACIIILFPMVMVLGFMPLISQLPLLLQALFSTAIAATGIVMSSSKYLQKNKERKINKLKEKYSYIDLNISKEELEDALEKAGIIRRQIVDNTIVKKIGLDEFEKNMINQEKYQKIKQELLEDNKYNYSRLEYDTDFSNQELKTKVKVKTLTRKGKINDRY